MVGRYIPVLLTVGVALAAYKLLGGDKFIEGFTEKELAEEYDYVIVGGGTSGGVLAARLAEGTGHEVLLLEAGENVDENEDIDIPIRAERLRHTEYDWSYMTVPQRHACKSHMGRRAIWMSGKGLGGSSNLNYMQYLRGSRHDYDEWAQNGATGWAYKDVLPYFIKSEDNRNPVYTRTVFHGYGGRQTVVDVELSPVTDIMRRSLNEFGIKQKDINGRSMFGFSQTQATIRRGTRAGTYRAFLHRARLFENLHIVPNALVTKVLFDGKKAEGVSFIHNGQAMVVKAKKEVILSAGTVGSAKLLLLSGVGPSNHLGELQIPVVADLPVGENLQDHVTSDGIEFYTKNQVSITVSRAESFESLWAYSLYGGGLQQSPRFREGTAYIRTRYQPGHLKYPLMALHAVANIGAYDPSHDNVREDVWNATHERAKRAVFHRIHGRPPSKEGFTVFPTLLHPRSKGTLRLKSANHEDTPLIDPNYLAEDADLKILTEGVQFTRRLINTKTMNDWGFTVNNKLMPECASFGNWTDQYVECYLRHVTLTGYAPVGTCKMGAATDNTAVVDPNLRVRGLKHLRVVDASIIPAAISGNTYTTQVMIAEKASDLILGKNTVLPIQKYFQSLIDAKHKKFHDDEDMGPVAGHTGHKNQ